MANLFLCNSSNISSDIGEKELLWTNPSPTSAFGAQTLALDLKDYDGVLIQCNYTASTNHNNALPAPNSYSFIAKGTTARLAGVANDTSTSSPITGRVATVADDGITFTSGIKLDGTATYDTNCVPCYIWGVNLGGYQTSDKYLRYNEASGWIQVYIETLDIWVNIYKPDTLPTSRHYLVKDGFVNGCNNFIMGTTTANSGFMNTNVESRLYVASASSQYQGIGFTVDLTNATKVVFENCIASGYKDGSGASEFAIVGSFAGDSSTIVERVYTVTKGENVEFDVSGLTGTYCIRMRVTSWGGSPYVGAQNIYVE